MLQAICCATISETSERMCRRAEKWKSQACTTVETCLLKLLVRSSVMPISFKLSLTATRRCVGCSARAWRWAVPMMMASDLLPLSNKWLRRNQCWRQLMQRESRSREPLSVISTSNCASSVYSWCLMPSPPTMRSIHLHIAVSKGTGLNVMYFYVW